MTKEIIVPGRQLAEYHWKSIKRNKPDVFERMQADLLAYGEKVSFGFNERLEPISCYVTI